MKSSIPSHLLFVLCLLGAAPFARSSYAETIVDPPALDEIDENTDIDFPPPSTTGYGTRGLSQTGSAEALGEGRVSVGLFGSWYQERQNFSGVPNKGANIFTEITSVSYGMNRYVDVFGALSGFSSILYHSNRATGLGAVGGGIQGTLPFPAWSPLRVAGQTSVFQGLSDNLINGYAADGYQYLEVRKHLVFVNKLLQTLAFGEERTAFKVHANEGLITSTQPGQGPLLLLALGAQYNLDRVMLGLELNYRTDYRKAPILPSRKAGAITDPLWITPGAQYRTFRNINLIGGVDIALSGERTSSNPRSLPPARLFLGLDFTFDTQFGLRRQIKENARIVAGLKSVNVFLMQKVLHDSVLMCKMANKDSLVKVTFQRKLEDDPTYCIEPERNLDENCSKYFEPAKKLLSMGAIQLEAVYFVTGQREIFDNSKPYLTTIATMLDKYPELQIEVSGHTDNVGSASYNLRLSQSRADAVKNYMITVTPGLKGRLTSKGYGMSQPKDENTTAEGRKRNRRIELNVLNSESLGKFNQ